jgi:hypothetical protein
MDEEGVWAEGRLGFVVDEALGGEGFVETGRVFEEGSAAIGAMFAPLTSVVGNASVLGASGNAGRALCSSAAGEGGGVITASASRGGQGTARPTMDEEGVWAEGRLGFIVDSAFGGLGFVETGGVFEEGADRTDAVLGPLASAVGNTSVLDASGKAG